MKNWKRLALVATILALSAVTVFAGAALAQGPGPANQNATGNAQANRHGNGAGGTGPGHGWPSGSNQPMEYCGVAKKGPFFRERSFLSLR